MKINKLKLKEENYKINYNKQYQSIIFSLKKNLKSEKILLMINKNYKIKIKKL